MNHGTGRPWPACCSSRAEGVSHLLECLPLLIECGVGRQLRTNQCGRLAGGHFIGTPSVFVSILMAHASLLCGVA